MAARPATLPASLGPVATGWGAAIGEDAFRIGPALAALVGAVLLQVGANIANDLFDYRKGADTSGRLGPPRAAQLGVLSERELLGGMAVTFTAALLVGLYLLYEGSWPVVAIGLGGMLAAITYTGGPWPYGYRALGDLFVFLFFGPVAVVGTYWVQAREAPLLPWLASLPVGALVTAILVVNNLRDRETDRRAGKVTLAVVVGDRGTRAWYSVLVLGALAAPLLMWAFGAGGPSLLIGLFAALVFLRPLAAIWTGADGRALNPVLRDTARGAGLFGLLFGIGLALS